MKKNYAHSSDKSINKPLQQTEDEVKNTLYGLLCEIYETGKIPRYFGYNIL